MRQLTEAGLVTDIMRGISSGTHQIIAERVRATPEKMALIDRFCALPHRDLGQAICEVAAVFQVMDVRPGNQISLMSEALSCLPISCWHPVG